MEARCSARSRPAYLMPKLSTHSMNDMGQFMLPEAWHEGTLAVAVLIQESFKEFFLDFDVDKSIGGDLVNEVAH